jgi:hypothetical protein
MPLATAPVHEDGDPMPTATPKRFYITRADDHAVIKSVPVSVCAAPQRVEIVTSADAPAENAVRVGDRPESRVAALTGRAAGRLHRPHLPHIGRSSR